MKALDVLLRFAYCAIVPAIIGGISIVVPVGGVVVGAALATAIALAGTDRWRAFAARIPLVGGGLAGMARLGDYYRARPPRPVLYYIFYPLLFPYWLAVREARGEFLLYRRINLLAFAVLLVFGATDYATHWYPVIGVNKFIGVAIGNFLVQSLLTMSAIMPLVTTIIGFHQEGRRKLLVALAIVGAMFTVSAVAFVAKDHHVHRAAEVRLRERAKAEPAQAAAALDAAVRAAEGALPAGARPGVIPGAPVDAARAALGALWLDDEVRAFRVWWSGPPAGVVMVFATFRSKDPVWAASDGRGPPITNVSLLPRGAQDELRRDR